MTTDSLLIRKVCRTSLSVILHQKTIQRLHRRLSFFNVNYITFKTTVALPSRERVAKRTSAAKMTAKELGKKSKVVPRKLTRPDDRTFVNFMATPKGHTPTKSNSTFI